MIGEHNRARQVGLLRLLLLALSLAILAVGTDQRQAVMASGTVEAARWLVAVVAVIAGILVATVGWVRFPGQLVLHLVFDLVWISMLIFLTGGVSSPAVVLLFAVVLIANLVLPGVAPFVMPALASLVMAGNAIVYLAGSAPFPQAYIELSQQLVSIHRIIGMLAVQVGALFLVDLLGQLLSKRLHEQRIFTGELLDQLGEGVLAVDRLGLVAYVNAEASRLLGLPGDLAGRSVAIALADPGLEVPLRLLTASQVPTLERWEGPHHRHLVLRVTALTSRRGRLLGRTLLLADESRLRILEENAQRAAHLADLGAMAAGIAHEVRNPLTSLRGCAQELAEITGSAGQADAAALATIMIGEADRLARIVNDFLAMSRLRAPELGSVDLDLLFAETMRLARARSDLPLGISLVAQVADECPLAHADEGQLRQIVSNLINNALDAVLHVQGPAITCRAGPAPAGNPLGAPAVVIEVTDNGCGIPVELQERVFTPFFSTKAQGTGLGLSLVSRIVREHEGLLSLDSMPGHGTTIRVLLPARSQTREYRRALGR